MREPPIAKLSKSAKGGGAACWPVAIGLLATRATPAVAGAEDGERDEGAVGIAEPLDEAAAGARQAAPAGRSRAAISAGPLSATS